MRSAPCAGHRQHRDVPVLALDTDHVDPALTGPWVVGVEQLNEVPLGFAQAGEGAATSQRPGRSRAEPQVDVG